MSDSTPDGRKPASNGTASHRSLLICVALLLSGAILIAVTRRGLVHDLANHVCGLAGQALALSGGLFLFHIWYSSRFRVTIGRLMTVVAIVAVLLQGVLAYRRWMLEGSPRPGGLQHIKTSL